MSSRGEGWVIGQFVIGIAIGLSVPFFRVELPLPLHWLAMIFIGVGLVILAAAVLNLGENFTVMPKPRDTHSLVTSGVYGFVRHPVYAGVILACFGWGLWWGSLLSLALSVVLFVWLDMKSRLEERWLTGKYPEYVAYQSRVKKLVPFVY